MKIFAHYDTSGTIRSIVTVNGPEGAMMMLTPRPGHLVAEVEDLPLKEGRVDSAEVRKLATSHRIELTSPRARIVRKT